MRRSLTAKSKTILEPLATYFLLVELALSFEIAEMGCWNAERRRSSEGKKDVLSERREPPRERKRLAAISPELSSLVVLDESEVEPRCEPAELDEDVGRLVPDQAGDVGDGDVEHG